MLAIIISLFSVVIAGAGVIYFFKKKQKDNEIINNLFSDRSFLVDQNREYSQKLQKAYAEIDKLKKQNKKTK